MIFFSWLNLGWVGSLIGIVGVISGIIFYIKSNKTTKPCYQYNTNIVVGKTESEPSKHIQILFKGKSVDNVKRTVVAIWNDGKYYLDKSVILDDKPLTVSFDDGDILSHQIKSKTNEAIKASTQQSEKGEVIVDFNYLDSKEGICLELLHTSNNDEPNVSCTIKGVKAGFVNKGKIITTNKAKKSKLINYLIPILGVAFITCGFLSFHISSMKKLNKEDFITTLNSYTFPFAPDDKNYANGWLMIASGIAYIAIPMVLKFLSRSKTPKNMDIS